MPRPNDVPRKPDATAESAAASGSRRRNACAAPVDSAGQYADADELEKYLVHLTHLDMALPLKIELIRTVRDMMQSFVDRAFGDDPSQLSLQAGGKWTKTDRGPGRSVVESPPETPQRSDKLTGDFRRNAGSRKE